MPNPKLLPKLLCLLPRSIFDLTKQMFFNYNHHILKIRNHKVDLHLQEEKREQISIQTGQENMKTIPTTMTNPKLLPRLLRPPPKSIIDPKNPKFLH